MARSYVVRLIAKVTGQALGEAHLLTRVPLIPDFVVSFLETRGRPNRAEVDLVDGVDRVDVVNRREASGCGARGCFCSLFANVVSVGEASRPRLIQD